MKYTWVRATFDQKISNTPGFLGCVILTPDSSQSQGDVTLYDGESTGDPQIITIRGGAGITKVVRFQPPLETQRGLYLDVGDNVEEVLIQHAWGAE